MGLFAELKPLAHHADPSAEVASTVQIGVDGHQGRDKVEVYLTLTLTLTLTLVGGKVEVETVFCRWLGYLGREFSVLKLGLGLELGWVGLFSGLV